MRYRLDSSGVSVCPGRVAAHHAWMHVEKLQELDGEAAYSRAQGED